MAGDQVTRLNRAYRIEETEHWSTLRRNGASHKLHLGGLGQCCSTNIEFANGGSSDVEWLDALGKHWVATGESPVSACRKSTAVLLQEAAEAAQSELHGGKTIMMDFVEWKPKQHGEKPPYWKSEMPWAISPAVPATASREPVWLAGTIYSVPSDAVQAPPVVRVDRIGLEWLSSELQRYSAEELAAYGITLAALEKQP